MLTFDFNLSLPVIILLACAAACALLVWPIYLRRISRVSRYAASQSGPEAYQPDTEHTADVTEPAGEGFLISNDDVSTDIATNDMPTGTEPASIVVYAQDEAESLTRLLHQLLEQRYAPGFEVIVVNEGGSETTADAVSALAVSHSNLYLTYTPDGARNLSRKKLALMLGIKAARHRVVVQTVATACIESPYWLASIMRHFTDTSTEVVLGNAMPAATDNGLGSRRRAFDFAASATAWLTSAIAGHPYRGTEYNIAYTRDIFFRNKGFSRSLNLRYGDDDIFISEIANGANTAVELSPDGLVRMAFHNHAAACSELAMRHEFTGRRISRTSRRLMALGAWMLWAMTGLAIWAAVISLPNIIPAIAAAVLLIAMFTAVTLVWRKEMRRLGGKKLCLTIPWLALTLPLRNAWRTLHCRGRHGRHYSWC